MSYGNRFEEVEYWKQWLEQEDEKKTVGYKVSKKLQELVKTRIEDVEKKNRGLKVENERLQVVKRVFDELGVRPCSWNLDDVVRERINEAKQVLPAAVRDSLRSTSDMLNKFVLELDKLEEKEREHNG